MKNRLLMIFTLALVASPTATMAAYTVTQGDSAPTYSTMLNFDEPGGPTGLVSTDAWQSIGITEFQSGSGDPSVGPSGQPWLGTGNSFFGNFGVFITFDTDISDMSLQVWDPSGPPSPFGGGMGIFLFDDGIEVSSDFYTPAWGGSGDEWFNIVANGGMVFDEIRILGFGFGPTTYVDNLSWNTAVVPVPGALLFMGSGLVSLVFARRRKSA